MYAMRQTNWGIRISFSSNLAVSPVTAVRNAGLLSPYHRKGSSPDIITALQTNVLCRISRKSETHFSRRFGGSEQAHAILFGPEGDFCEDEYHHLSRNNCHFNHPGKQIVRADLTARDL
jgi:hypothetical protein